MAKLWFRVTISGKSPKLIIQIQFNECSLKSLLTPKSPKGDFFKLLIFSSSSLRVRSKNGENQQFEGFLYYTHLIQ
ncbi:hypothetical protein [Anaerophaga thermohalophila]|uniref:hypothetical protein n=1 Tax=Anaerophaga thermohalophila TaxID=177400 RepID=UPI0009D9DB0D